LFGTKLMPKPGSELYTALPWLFLSTLIWITPALVVVGITLDSLGYLLAALFLVFVIAVALHFSDRQKPSMSRWLRTLTEYPQVGLLAAACVLLIAGTIHQESTFITFAIASLVASVIFSVVLNITRPSFLISRGKSSLGTYTARTTRQRDFPKSDKKVSIVMPCFNEDRFLNEAIESVRAQTHANWELIIVDDCSVDDSTRIAAEAASKDKRIHVIRLRRNSGLPSARNAGFVFATGEFVIFLDGDDALLPHAISSRLSLASEFPESAGVGARTKQVPERTNWRTFIDEPKKPANSIINLVKTNGDSPFGVHEMMVKSSLVRKLSGFEEKMTGGAEDAHFWLRSLKSGEVFSRTNIVDSIYRQKTSSMINQNLLRQAVNTVEVMEDSWYGSDGLVSNDLAKDNSTGSLILKSRLQTRLFRFLGMTYWGENLEARAEIEELIKNYLPIVLHEDKIVEALDNGVTRSIARDSKASDDLSSEKFISDFIAVAQSWSKFGINQNKQQIVRPNTAVLIETAAQLDELAKEFHNAPSENLPLLVFSENLDAPQGALDKFQNEGLRFPHLSFVSFVLEAVKYEQIYLPAPISFIGNEIVNIYKDSGCKVIQWNLPWSSSIDINDDDYLNDRLSIFDIESETSDTAAIAGLGISKSLREFIEPSKPLAPGLNSVTLGGSVGDYKGLIRPDLGKLQALKNKHKGERCIIIGNGPSLNQTDFNLLKDQTTFGVNGIFYADDRLPQPLSYYVVEDTKVFEENTEAILEYGRGCGEIILPTLYKENVPNPDEVTFFRMNGGFYRKQDPNFCRPRFSTNAAEVMYCGQSVTYINLQLAYWMGFKEVGLIGMDFSYTLPPGTVVKGHLYESQEDDPNHFDPRYFGAGKTWKNPYLNRVAANYELAKSMYEADGRIIYNCTVGGKLEVFERLDLSDFVKENR
jgi:glycosyltransferase involved in cell wall biosynthesis